MVMLVGCLIVVLGYKKGIVVGLVIVGVGVLGFWLVVVLYLYLVFFGVLFVLVIGIIVL